MNEYDMWNRQARAAKWRQRKSAIGSAVAGLGSCIAAIAVVVLGLATAGALIFAIVRIVRIAWAP